MVSNYVFSYTLHFIACCYCLIFTSSFTCYNGPYGVAPCETNHCAIETPDRGNQMVNLLISKNDSTPPITHCHLYHYPRCVMLFRSFTLLTPFS